jgi:soluble cytochrome b562
MIRKIAIALLASTVFGALPAYAQLGIVLGGKSSSSSSSAAVPDVAAQDALVRQFVAARVPEINAQVEFAKAFGLAEQAQALEVQKQALSSGAVDKAALEKAREIGVNAQKQIDAKAAEKPALDVEAKAHYTEGLSSLALATVEAAQLTGAAQKFVDGLKAVKGTDALTLASKLAAGVYVSKEAPGYVSGLFSSTKSALTYARANNINVPANADALTF